MEKEIGNCRQMLPGYVYSKLLDMIPNLRGLYEDIAIQKELRAKCMYCNHSQTYTKNDNSYFLEGLVDERNDHWPLAEAIISAHTKPWGKNGLLEEICYVCERREQRIVTDIKVLPKRLLLINLLHSRAQTKYRSLQCPKDNLEIGKHVYKRLIASLGRTDVGKFVLRIRQPDNTWRLINGYSVSEIDPTDTLENPVVGDAPVLLFYAND
jgi:hypothetical protein